MSMPTNIAHWHLVLNHIPLFFVGIGVLVLMAGLWRDSFELKVTSLVLFFLAGSVIVPVAYTGEGAEHLLEDHGGIDDSLMEQHEESGKTTRNIVVVLGLLSLVSAGIYLWKQRIPNWYLYLVLLVGIGAMYFVVRTANLGGKARHVEIRPPDTATQAPTRPSATEETHEE